MKHSSTFSSSLPLFLSIWVLVIMSTVADAQHKFNLYPDSIRVELPDLNALVVFEMRNYPEANEVIRNFPQTLTESLEYVKKSSPVPLTASDPLYIEIQSMPEGTKQVKLSTKPFGEKKVITIRPMEPRQTTMTVVKEKGIVEMLPPGWELHMISKAYRIKVYAIDFASLEAIATQDFSAMVDKINSDKEMAVLGRRTVESQVIIRENKIDQSAVKYVFPGDNISMGFQGGVGLYQNIIYPELTARVALTFKDRFRRNNFRVALTYSNLFFSERTTGGFDLYNNSFVSGTIEKNFNRKTDQTQWSGIGIGFLTRSSNDYFRGNTAKLFIPHSILNSHFIMVPEFYLTDDFKKFNFGMTLKYSF